MGQVLDIQTARHQVALAENGGAGRGAVEAAYADLRVAMLAAETPAQKIERLLVEARDLDERADQCIKEAAEYAGKAAHRRNQGEAQLAADFQRMADARDKLAVEYGDQAFALKLERAGLIAQEDLRQFMRETTRGLCAMAGE